MSTNNVYLLQHWDRNEDHRRERPSINTRDPRNKCPWILEIDTMLRDPEITLVDYEPVRFVVKRRDADEWDTYEPMAGYYPMLSERAVDLLKPYMPDFTFVEAWVNERKFFFPRWMKKLDCLDREHSEFELYSEDSDQIMEFERFAFFKERIPDPLIFDIPEGPFGLFATNSIKQIVEEAGLKGFFFYDAEVRRSWARSV